MFYYLVEEIHPSDGYSEQTQYLDTIIQCEVKPVLWKEKGSTSANIEDYHCTPAYSHAKVYDSKAKRFRSITMFAWKLKQVTEEEYNNFIKGIEHELKDN